MKVTWEEILCDECPDKWENLNRKSGVFIDTYHGGLDLCRRHLFQLRDLLDKIEDEHEEAKV